MLVFVSDVHVGHYPEFDVNGSRLERCLNALDQVFEFAKENDATVIDCGDLIERKNLIDFTVYNPLFDLFSYYEDVEKIVLVGNHNLALRDGTQNNLHPLSPFAKIVDRPLVLRTRDGITLRLLPYTTNLALWRRWYQDGLAWLDDHPSFRDKSILVAHQEITGAVTGTHRYVAKDGLDPDGFSDGFQFNLFGHYHLHQKIRPNVWYVGALLQQDFGEEGNPQGFWSFALGRSPQWMFHEIEAPQFKTITDAEELDQEIAWGNYVRLRADVDANDIAERARTLTRIEKPAIVEDTSTRLNTGTESLPALVDAYVRQKIPADRQAEVRELLRTMNLGV